MSQAWRTDGAAPWGATLISIDGATSHGVAAAQDLADDVLLELIRSDDPVGMLSTYVDGAAVAAYGGAAIDIGNRVVSR